MATTTHTPVNQAANTGIKNTEDYTHSPNKMVEMYFLVKDKKSAEALAHELHREAAVEDESLKSITSFDRNADEIEGLQPATTTERSDVLFAAMRGGCLGILGGLLLLVLLSSLPVIAPYLTMGIMLAVLVFSALAGCWFSTLIGVNVPHPKFRRAIANIPAELDDGRVLILVKVKAKMCRYIAIVSKHLVPNGILSVGRL